YVFGGCQQRLRVGAEVVQNADSAAAESNQANRLSRTFNIREVLNKLLLEICLVQGRRIHRVKGDNRNLLWRLSRRVGVFKLGAGIWTYRSSSMDLFKANDGFIFTVLLHDEIRFPESRHMFPRSLHHYRDLDEFDSGL